MASSKLWRHMAQMWLTDTYGSKILTHINCFFKENIFVCLFFVF